MPRPLARCGCSTKQKPRHRPILNLCEFRLHARSRHRHHNDSCSDATLIILIAGKRSALRSTVKKKNIAFWGAFLLVPLGVLLPLRALARRRALFCYNLLFGDPVSTCHHSKDPDIARRYAHR